MVCAKSSGNIPGLIGMSVRFLRSIRFYLTSRAVRPWGLAAPVVALLIALPLLRPLLQPGELSDPEYLLVQTTQSLVDRGTLALPPAAAAIAQRGVIVVEGRYYADQPPVYAVLLSGPSRLLDRMGLGWIDHPDLHLYLLTLLGATLPTALASALIYRTSRIFELRRPMRAMLALATLLGTGWISYATVLNPHAPAAALLLAGLAVVLLVAASPAGGSIAWYLVAGACLALAGAIDAFAVIPALAIAIAPLALPRTWRVRSTGIALLLVGGMPAVLLHVAWWTPLTGEILPRWHHPELSIRPPADAPIPPIDDPEVGPIDDSLWLAAGRQLNRWIVITFGAHGLLSHFPILVIALLGVVATLRRHWPGGIKLLAATTTAAVTLTVIGAVLARLDWRDAMFACRWLIAGLPLLMLWAGAWLKRSHHPATWALAACLLAISTAVSLIGAVQPMPPSGFTRHTAIESAQRIIDPPPMHEQRIVLVGG